MQRRPLATLALAVLAFGCAGAGPRASGAPGGSQREGLGWSRPPVVGGSRVACLAPPYTPAPDATALADGTPARREADGRRWVIALPGEREPTPEEASALIQRLRARGGDLRWIGYGAYCGEDASSSHALCLHWEGNLCEVRVDEIARALRDAIAADAELPSPRIDLAIELAGRLGPRCDDGDPECVPIPYEREARWSPRGGRRPGPLPEYSGGACEHDGECVVGGCGNHCMGWQYGGAHEAATCEGYALREPIYCGCVEHRCAWFEQ